MRRHDPIPAPITSAPLGSPRLISAGAYHLGSPRLISASAYHLGSPRLISAGAYHLGSPRLISAGAYHLGSPRLSTVDLPSRVAGVAELEEQWKKRAADEASTALTEGEVAQRLAMEV